MVMNTSNEQEKLEQEFKAHVNLFELILVGEKTHGDYESFCADGGKERLTQLINDLKNGNLLFTVKIVKQDYHRPINDLYTKMFTIRQELSQVAIKNNQLLDSKLYNIDYLEKFYISHQSNPVNDFFCQTPACVLERILPKELVKDMNEFLENNDTKQPVSIYKIIEEDIKEEKRFYAHINLFKLLLTTELCGKDYNYFCLMRGCENLESLEQDIKENYISLWEQEKSDNLSKKELFQFYQTMYHLNQKLNEVGHSKSTLLNNAFKDYDRVTKFYINECQRAKLLSDNSGITQLDVISWLKENLPEELVDKIETMESDHYSCVKKLGERK